MRPHASSARVRGSDGQDDVLELRVHGVANTPPASMLGLRQDQLVQLDGDDLGSFWAAAPGVGPFPADDPRQPPPGVRREAYSWGAMARLSTLPGVGRVSGTLAGLARALWVLIIPFGFTNVAYWARDLDERTGRRSSASGGLVRLFGLVLTLLWTATAATVTLGVVAAQCYRPRMPLPGGGGTYVLTCRALPGAIDSWARWSVGTRTAVLAGVAAACVLVLAGIGSTGRLRYERHVSTTRARGLADAPPVPPGGWPVLARRGFWTRSMRSAVLWFQHLTGAFALLTGVLAWHFLFRHSPGCVALHGFGANGCLAGTLDAGRWPWTVMVAASVVLVVWAGWRVSRLRLDPLPPGGGGSAAVALDKVSRAPDAVAFALALGVFGWCLTRVGTSGDAPLTDVVATGAVPARPLLLGATGPFAGLDDLPMLLAAVLLLLAIVAVGLRARVPAFVWAPLLVLTLAGALGGLMWPTGATAVACWSVAGGACAVLVVVVAVARARITGRERLGWGGRGPFVFLVCAAGIAMVLSSATVLGVVAWLERPGKPEASAVPAQVADALKAVDAADPLRAPVLVDVPTPATPHLEVPAGYEQFAVASIGVLALFALLILVLVLRMVGLGRRPVPDVPLPKDAPRPPPARTVTPEQAAIQTGRHHAALAERAERVVGALAWLFLAALVATLLLPPAHADVGGPAGAVWDWAVQWSTSAVVACVGVLVTSVVVAGSKKSLTRPFGLLWDLMCFLPRAAHPFAPPCYAERVVPELRSRIDAWLGDDGSGPPPPGRRVVLSVHSLGAVVAVQVLLARWDGPAGPFDGRVAVLSYGAQLRAYFGRFFPELFGPGVLGTRGSRGSRPWAADPWQAAPATPNPSGLTLVDTLTPPGRRTRWRNLWRRTDFIGFPVDDYVPTPRGIDHAAGELDPTAYMMTVAAHSGYPETREYREQLGALVDELRRPVRGRRHGPGRGGPHGGR